MALVPERLAALGGASRVPLVTLSPAELVLLEPAAAVGPDARVDVAALDEAARRDATRRLLERVGEARGRVRLCLEPSESLVRRVRMPAATEENLRQVVAFEMDRLTPFRADDVYFDCRVVGRDATAGTIQVLLALARREGVDAKMRRLEALGTTVAGVTVRDERGHPADLELLPSETLAGRNSAQERYVLIGAFALVALLAAAALSVPVYHKREAVVNGYPLLDRARTEAESTDNIAHDLEKQVADYNFLLAKKHSNYPVLALLEEVTRLLPDNTWVQQVDVKTVGKTREVQVSGEAPSSSKLIEIFEQSRVLQNAQTRGTVTRGSQPSLERFMIVAEPRPRPPPEAQSLLEGPVPVITAPSPVAAPAAPPPTAPKPGPKPAEVKPIPPKGATR